MATTESGGQKSGSDLTKESNALLDEQRVMQRQLEAQQALLKRQMDEQEKLRRRMLGRSMEGVDGAEAPGPPVSVANFEENPENGNGSTGEVKGEGKRSS